MQPRALNLKAFEVPAHLSPEDKASFREVVGALEKTRAHYEQQIEFIKQQYKAALRRLRPDVVTPAVLREMFDEAEITVSSMDEIDVQDDEAPKPRPKKKKKKPARGEKFLGEMDKVVPRADLLALILPSCPTVGRRGHPPMPPSVMLRIHFMQQWYA